MEIKNGKMVINFPIGEFQENLVVWKFIPQC